MNQPEPEHLARAGDLLEGILLGDPDPQIRIVIARALAILSDVHPPYAPGPEITEAIPVRQGVDQALEALRAAVQAASSVDDILRAGLAGRALHDLRPEP
jgi:hypothetical protein